MRTKRPEIIRTIIEYVNSFFQKELRTSSIREIEIGTGISRPTVQRYLVEMDEKGTIQYDGSNIITSFIKRMASNSVTQIPLAGMITCDEFRSEEEWKGKFLNIACDTLANGTYFSLLADGDSMIEAGINKGDYVVVRQSSSVEYG